MTARTVATPLPARTPGFLSRVFGYGSVFGKTLRDSRRATLAVAIFMGLL
jgi:hypothetical protein